MGLQSDRVKTAKPEEIVTLQDAQNLAQQIGCLVSVQLSSKEIETQQEKFESFINSVVTKTLKTELGGTIRMRRDGLLL